MTTQVKLAAVAMVALLCTGCSSDDGTPTDGAVHFEATPSADHGALEAGKAPDGKPAGDGKPVVDGKPVLPPDGQPTTGQPGNVCTQQNKTCGTGLKCVFLDAWNAPKGTCVRALSDGCKSWDDPRCVVAGKNYSVMCGPYTENTTSVDICFLLCDLNGKTYDCPPLHTCKALKGYNVCIPS